MRDPSAMAVAGNIGGGGSARLGALPEDKVRFERDLSAVTAAVAARGAAAGAGDGGMVVMRAPGRVDKALVLVYGRV